MVFESSKVRIVNESKEDAVRQVPPILAMFTPVMWFFFPVVTVDPDEFMIGAVDARVGSTFPDIGGKGGVEKLQAAYKLAAFVACPISRCLSSNVRVPE